MIKSRLFIFVLFLLPMITLAQQPLKDVAGFKSRLTEATRKITSIENSFVQEKNLSVLSEKIITKGKFYLKKENKLRWEYTSPFTYIFILNNGKVWIKDEDKQNKFDVRSNKMFGEINSILIRSVQGTLLDDEKNFSAKYFENQNSFIVRLKPRSSRLSEYMSEIVITFDKKELSVVRLEMIEPSGDNTRIDFTSRKYNTITSDEKFIIP